MDWMMDWRKEAVKRQRARIERIEYLVDVSFGHKLNLELLDRESQTTECFCCGVECYKDGSHTQHYIDDGLACRYSEV